MSIRSRGRFVRACLISGVSSLVLGSLLTAGVANAQDKPAVTNKAAAADAAEAPGTEVEAVVVTGSHLRGTPTTAVLPVESTSIEDMRNQGTPSPTEFAKSLSESGTTVGEANRNNLFAVGAAAINLRDLGPNRTIVLFNGRRWPETFSFSVGRYININQLPAFAVGRIEVLKDGGASTYGADAVGGVVNYISRRGFDGVEINANYKYIKDADGDYDASILLGKKFDNFDVMGGLGYERRNLLEFVDRDWAIVNYLQNPQAYVGRGNPGAFALNIPNTAGAGAPFTPISVTGTLVTVGGLPVQVPNSQYTGNRQIGTFGVMRDPACQALGGFAGWSTAGGGVSPICYQSTNYLSNLAEQQESWHGYAEANWQISDKFKAHGEFVYYGLDIPKIPLDTFTNTVSAWPFARNAAGQFIDNATGAVLGASATPQFQNVPGSTLRAYYVPGTNPAVGNMLANLRNADGSPALTPTQIAAITTGGGRVALPEGIWRPFDIGGSPYSGREDFQHNASNQYRYTLEFSGNLGKLFGGDWDWSFAGTNNKIDYTYKAPDILVDRLQAALNGLGGPNCTGATPGANGCMYFNPFSSSVARNIYTGQTNPYFVNSGSFAGYTAGKGLTNDPSLINWLYSANSSLYRHMDYVVFDALLSGSLDYHLWSKDPIQLAIGAQYRELHETEDLNDAADLSLNPCPTQGVTRCTSTTGATVFQRGALVTGFRQDYDRRYPVEAAFAEAKVPITDSLNFQASTRWEKFFSDVGASDNETVVTSGGLRWQALSWLAFRGTAGQSFAQISPPAPANPVSTSNGTVPTQFGSGAASFNTVNYANTGIRPETGFNYNVGTIIQAGNILATIDYYDIKLDSIASALGVGQVELGLTDPSTNGAATKVNCNSPLLTTPVAEFGGKPFVEVTNSGFTCVQGVTTMQQFLQSAANGGAQPNFNFFGSQGQENRTFNGPGLHTNGVDVNIRYLQPDVLGGDLTVTADATYILKYQRDPFILGGTQVAPGFDGVGYSNTSPRTGERVYAWRGSLTFNYRHGPHNINVVTRIVPGLIGTTDTLYDLTSASQNANISGANGFTDTTYCSTHQTPIIAPPVPNAAGTAEFGVPITITQATVNGSGVTTNAGTGAVGYDPCQNFYATAGTKIPASFSTDVTYRYNWGANTTLTLAVQNVLDKDPGFSRDGTNYDPGGAQGPLGRTFRVGILKRY
ncbi:MAG TPA: TonB-dependent receptor [Caulobacteraceae bacterium]|nr:TonB-dependent receptor [Caulobacteraceae bacterium]